MIDAHLEVYDLAVDHAPDRVELTFLARTGEEVCLSLTTASVNRLAYLALAAGSEGRLGCDVEGSLEIRKRTKGLELSWSDRSVRPEDPEGIADAIVACALDHAYDRGEGVPMGLPEEQREACLSIVARHLSAVEPEWRTKTVCGFTEEQRAALKADLVRALR